MQNPESKIIRLNDRAAIQNPKSKIQNPQPPSLSPKQTALNVGLLAEALVAQWLVSQDWTILQRRWHCRWGELDLVAYSDSVATLRPPLIFVEVKARSRGNWDADGLAAITPQKQAKLWQAAHLFLAEYPHLAHFPCCFDVALVQCQRLKASSPASIDYDRIDIPQPIHMGQPVAIGQHRLTLQQYIPAAFD